MIADGRGRAAAFALAPGQAHELPLAPGLLARLPRRPLWVVADRGYAGHAFRERVRGLGARPAVPAGTHAVVVLDRAGWHVSADLAVPASLTLVHLPPCSPELNPVERVWLHLRERWLSHRVLADYDAVLGAACAAWNALRAEPGRLRSLTSYPWLPRSVQTS